MPRLDPEDCSRATLEGLAKSVARTIDAGTDPDPAALRSFLDRVIAALPTAPEYDIDQRGPRYRR